MYFPQAETIDTIHMRNSTRIYRVDELFPKIDNIQFFPTEILLPIFTACDRDELLHLASTEHRFKIIANEVFRNFYASEYVVIEGTDRERAKYTAQLNIFGESITAIEIRNIDHIDNHNWLIQLINAHTKRLRKLCFVKCSFTNVDDLLSKHQTLTHLTLRKCECEGDYKITFPEYHDLEAIELFDMLDSFWKPSFEQILRNNPHLESLILNLHAYDGDGFSRIIEMTQLHLKKLKKLCLMGRKWCSNYRSNLSTSSLDNAWRSLESIAISIGDASVISLLEQLTPKFYLIKHLELDFFINELTFFIQSGLFDQIRLFDRLESLSLHNVSEQYAIEVLVARLPNLRDLSLSRIDHRTNAEILSIIGESAQLRKLVFDFPDATEQIKDYKLNVQFHDAFIQTMPNAHTRIEFKENGKIIGFVTKDEIVWRNKLIHWVGYMPSYSQSNVHLLDLAHVPEGYETRNKKPLNLIFNYLDLNSLYEFSKADVRCEQLVQSYIQTIRNGKLVMTDEFGFNLCALRKFNKRIINLEVNLLKSIPSYYLSIEYDIRQFCTNLTTLHIRRNGPINPHLSVFPSVQHLICHCTNKDYTIDCELSWLSSEWPNLEVLELRTSAKLYTVSNRPSSFRNLRKIRFKPFDDESAVFAIDYFKDTNTEVIIDC